MEETPRCMTLAELEKDAIQTTLHRTNQHLEETSRQLGISRWSLRRKMARHKLTKGAKHA